METDENDFLARNYQIDLYEAALKENTIIYLPTGSGKTYIAVMLIKELSQDIRIPYSQGGKHSVFVVNTVPLVIQQGKYISRLTGLSCGLLSGDMLVDLWKDTEWKSHLEKNQILVMTAQILLDALLRGYMHLNRINLIIFDECHRAVNAHPMRLIMQRFQLCCKEEQPKVLAMSATLLNSNVKISSLKAVIQELEVTFQAKVATVKTQSQIKNYQCQAKQVIIEYDEYVNPDIYKRISDDIKEVHKILDVVVLKDSLLYIDSSEVFKPKSKTKKIKCMLTDILEQFSLLGVYGASMCVLYYLIQLECIRKRENDLEFVHLIEYIITVLVKFRKILQDEMKDDTETNKIHKYSSDHVIKTLCALVDYHTKKPDDGKFSCIIFVQRKITAKILNAILNNISMHNEKFKFLHNDFVVGVSSDPFDSVKNVMYSSKCQNEVIHKFRNGLTNCLIATDIIDEGIDIKACSLIIRFYFPPDIRAHIQSKGRNRSSSSNYVLMVQKNNQAYVKRIGEYNKIESFLNEFLIGKTEYRVIPAEDQICNNLYKYDIEPFSVIGKDGIERCITEYAAIPTINRYCSVLLKSLYVNLTPNWILKTFSRDPPLYRVSLKLPNVSPLRTVIYGDKMQSINSAKRSAAMKMCIELYKIGELNDNLLPNTMRSIEENIDYLFPNWNDEDTNNVGTYKNKRHHTLQYPPALYGAYPLPSEISYLHLLRVTPTYPISHDDNRGVVYSKLLQDDAGFAILSTKRMPEIPSFPVFMKTGEINVDVQVNYKTMHFSKEEIHYMKVFHTLVFTEIVPVIKYFMVFDNYNLDNCFLIVPVNRKCEINWPVIREYQHIERIPPSVPFSFNISDYELALVVPTYRPSAETYIVTKVCDYLNPNSCFPTDDFDSFVHYYKQKHDIQIHNLSQPLLEVIPISRRINFIIPGSIQTKNFKEHFIPQLCSRIKFPALYWLKAKMLPSILHRISQFLIAEDLRCTIAKEVKLGSESSNDKWAPLVITEKKSEELSEAFVEAPVEYNVEHQEIESEIGGPEVDVLNTEVNHYPWPKDQEPPRLENMEEYQLIHIEHYCQFISTPCDQHIDIMKTAETHFVNVSPVPAPLLKILTLKDTTGPDPVQIMYALTSKSAKDAFDLERLEILGDAYLKYVISLFLFVRYPYYNEGHLTTLKGRIVNNRNLYYCGVKRNIAGRMKVDEFHPLSNFVAPAYTVFRELQQILLDAEVSPNVLYEIQIPKDEQFEGHITETTKSSMQETIIAWDSSDSQTGMEHYLGIQAVSDKTVADCVEALIGVYLTTMGIENTVTLLMWFQILPKQIDFNQLFHIVEDPIVSPGNVDYFMPWASAIETRIGYKFKNRAYLLQAFTHPSYTKNNITNCYERLEFIGDAILDFLITCYIYENFKNLSPGTVTDLRSALVNNITLACLSVRYGLYTGLLAYAPNLNNPIDRFVKFQEERNHIVNDELLWILLEEHECTMAEYIDVPKVLGDLFESTIGAIYLDCGKDLEKVWEIIYSLMQKEINEFSKNIPKQPIRVLYECQGAQPKFSNATPVEGTESVMVSLQITIAGKRKIFYGFGTQKRLAKHAAAKLALKSLLHKA